MKMDVVLLLILAAAGLGAVSARVHRQYHFVYDRKNLTEAQRHCRDKYSDLATIDSMEDVKVLNNMADKGKTIYSEYSGAYIGLYNDIGNWRWSLSDTSFYSRGETEFRHWQSGRPDKYNLRDACVQIDKGRWYDTSCGDQSKAVCMDVTGLNVTFVLINDLMTWTEAQSYCRNKHTDLASVRNMEEHQRVEELVPSGEEAWIGLFKTPWKWLDGRSLSFTYWKPGEPNNNSGRESCVAANFDNSGKWEDWDCDRRAAFICYSRLATTTKQVFKVRLRRKDSALNLNDPAVMEQILKQLQQKLKDQGLNEGVRLSWRKQPDGKVFHKEEKKKEKKESRTGKDEL